MNTLTLQFEGSEPLALSLTAFGATWTQVFYPLPAAPLNLIASQAEFEDRIELNWSPVLYAQKYRVRREGIVIAEPSTPPFTDGGLSPGSVYSYSVTAVNATGESAPTGCWGSSALPAHDSLVRVGMQIGRSTLRVGIVHADNVLLWGNTTAIASAKDALRGKVALQKTFVQGWGPGRIWPYEGSPTGILPTDPKTIAFGTLDKQMNTLVDIDAPILIAFFMLPWWMRQKLDGTYLTPQEEYSEAGRLRTDCIPHWQLLVRSVAMRYLVPPYNVREFEVGAEPKGFYNRRDGKNQSWEWDDYEGTAGKADMGWTAFYKLTVQAVLSAASMLSIDPNSLRFWAPYTTTPSRTVTPTADMPPLGHPLRDRPWGYAVKAWLEFTSKFLDLWSTEHFRLDGLMVDGGSGNKDGTAMDPWLAMNKFEDIMAWLRSETARVGVPNLPIAWGEWYPNSQVDAPEEYRALLRAEGLRLMLVQGADYVMSWQAQGAVPGPGAQLYSNANVASGGVAKPQLAALDVFNRLFPVGTPLYTVRVEGEGLSAAASDRSLFLLNRLGVPQTVWVDGKGLVILGAESWQVVTL